LDATNRFAGNNNRFNNTYRIYRRIAGNIWNLSFIVAIILILFFLGTTILSIYKFKKPIATGNVPGLELDPLYLAGSILLLFSGPGEYAIFAGLQLSTFIQI